MKFVKTVFWIVTWPIVALVGSVALLSVVGLATDSTLGHLTDTLAWYLFLAEEFLLATLMGPVWFLAGVASGCILLLRGGRIPWRRAITMWVLVMVHMLGLCVAIWCRLTGFEVQWG